MFFSQPADKQPKILQPGNPTPQTGLVQNFDAMFEKMQTGDAIYAVEAEMREGMAESFVGYKEATGEDLPQYLGYSPYMSIVRDLEGEDPKWEVNAVQDQAAMYHEIKTKLQNAKDNGMAVQTLDEIWRSVQDKAKASEINAAEIARRQDTFGFLGQMAGAVAGSFTTRDPVNLATLFLASPFKGLALKIAGEMGLQGTIELINQITGVAENRRLLGLDQDWKRSAQMAGFASLGGFIHLAPPAAKLVGKGGRIIEGQVAPRRALGRELLNDLDEVTGNLDPNAVIKAFDKARRQGAPEALNEVVYEMLRRSASSTIKLTGSDLVGAGFRQTISADALARTREYSLTGKMPPSSIPVPEFRGVPLSEINAATSAAAGRIDWELDNILRKITALDADIAKTTSKAAETTQKLSIDYLAEVNPKSAARLREIDAIDKTNLNKAQRRALADEYTAIRNSDEANVAKANQSKDATSFNKQKSIQNKKINKLKVRQNKLIKDRERLGKKITKEYLAKQAKKNKQEDLPPPPQSVSPFAAKLTYTDYLSSSYYGGEGALVAGLRLEKELAEGTARKETQTLFDDAVESVKDKEPFEVAGAFINKNMEVSRVDGNGLITVREAIQDMKETKLLEDAIRFCRT
tara:strand:- start:2093 stop:3997 length:1905 start_codon:yes stop_codon:yes gene_type:complete